MLCRSQSVVVRLSLIYTVVIEAGAGTLQKEVNHEDRSAAFGWVGRQAMDNNRRLVAAAGRTSFGWSITTETGRLRSYLELTKY